MLTLYHAPLACSLASRLALHESKLPHRIEYVHTTRGEQHADDYLAVNPRGQVPTLVTDEGPLTESSAILPFIADMVPEMGLFPPAGTYARGKGQAWLSFLSSSLHAAFSAVITPKSGPDSEIAQDAALERLAKAYLDVDTYLEGREYLLDSFSICDIYLAVFAMWRAAPAVAGKMPALPNIDRVQQAVFARPGYFPIVGEEMKLRTEAA